MTCCRVLLMSHNSPYMNISRTLARKLDLNPTDSKNIKVFCINKPRLENEIEPFYIPWKGDYSNTTDHMTVELSGKHYGHIFCTDMIVDIILMVGIKSIKEITVIAKEKIDYENLCLHSNWIENVLLQQFPVMHVNQIVQLEVSPINFMVAFVVKDFGNSNVTVALLSEETSVTVLPPSTSDVGILDNQLHITCAKNLFYLVSALCNSRVLPDTYYQSIRGAHTFRRLAIGESSTLSLNSGNSRVTASQNDTNFDNELICYFNPLWIQLLTEISSYPNSVHHHHFNDFMAVISSNIYERNNVMCRLYPDTKVPMNHIAIHKNIMLRLKINAFDLLCIRIIDKLIHPPAQKFEIILQSTYEHNTIYNKCSELYNIQQEFIRNNRNKSSFLLSSGDIVTIPGNSYLKIPKIDYVVKIVDFAVRKNNDLTIPSYVVVDSLVESEFIYFLDSIKIVNDSNPMNSDITRNLLSETIQHNEYIKSYLCTDHPSSTFQLTGFENFAIDFSSYLQFEFKNDFTKYKSLYNLEVQLGLNIYGPFKCGKTSALQFMRSFTDKHYPFVKIKFLDCAVLEGEPLKVIMECFEHLFLDTMDIGPYFIIIDNLDVLVHNSASGRYLFLHIDRLLRKADRKKKKLFRHNNYTSKSILTTSPVYVVISSSIPMYFKSLELYNLKISINESNKAQLDVLNDEVLKLFGNLKFHEQGNDPASEDLTIFDGTSVHEIKTIIRKFISCNYEACNSLIMSQSGHIIDNDLSMNKVLYGHLLNIINEYKGTTKNVQQGVSLRQLVGASITRFEIIRALYLPISLKRLYSKYPTVLASRGILLYGPSGCGKTLIAEAAGSFNGLDFVSVRGPELLTKYIGSSEKAVRDLFSNAISSGKPTLILFDELDALCPKRGRDNSVITDRVVNQLLTCIDGVDSATENVYIIATTIRPDLIDPALLRPGRIDKHLFVDLPKVSERKQILDFIINNINSDKNNAIEADNIDVVVQKIVNDSPKIDQFSAADLKAIVDNSYMLLIAENISNPNTSLCLTGRHIWVAYQQINGSLSENDLRCYNSSFNSSAPKAELMSYK